MAKRKSKEIVLEPKLDKDTIPEVIEEPKSEIIELDDDEELHGELSHDVPDKKTWKRQLRRL